MLWVLSLAVTAAISIAISARAAQDAAAVDLIRRECSACHGARGISIAPTFPHLAGQHAPYLEAQLKAFRDRSRADPHAQAFMWGMAAQLADRTIEEIAAYYAVQPPAPGRPASAADIEAGKRIYEEGIEEQVVPACQSCHLRDAVGAALVPRLAGQHRRYLEKQLAFYVSGRRDNPIMREVTKNLTTRQMSQVAAFLSAHP
jgi:cytochrome c553